MTFDPTKWSLDADSPPALEEQAAEGLKGDLETPPETPLEVPEEPPAEEPKAEEQPKETPEEPKKEEEPQKEGTPEEEPPTEDLALPLPGEEVAEGNIDWVNFGKEFGAVVDVGGDAEKECAG